MRLSIITINLNNAAGLKKTISSVVEQNFNDFEYIIIDGGSTDNSEQVINEYSKSISYYTSEKDSGIYEAMNKGIKAAKGEYLIFLNSGDRFANNTVLTEVFKLNPSKDIVYGIELTELNGVVKENTSINPEHITFNSFVSTSLPHQCTFIRKRAFETVGLYNEKNKIVSDWEWTMLALFKYNCSIEKMRIPIAYYETKGISNDRSLMSIHLAEKERSLKDNFPRLLEDSENYFRLLEKYNRIPKVITGLFNRLSSSEK